MAWPFTPITTFIAKSVPKVTAAFLNAIQKLHNAVFAPVYHARPSIYVESYDGTNVLVFAASLTIKDSVTGEYVYIPQVGRTVSTTWPTSAWRYLYLVSSSGVASVEVSSTAPATAIAGPLFKNGDETRRYLCAVRCDGGGGVVKFNMIDGRYTYLDDGLYIQTAAVGTGAWANVSAAAYVPPHVRRIDLKVRIQNASGGFAGASYRSYNTGGILLSADANSFDECDLKIATASDTIEWNAPATTTVYTLVRGWEE